MDIAPISASISASLSSAASAEASTALRQTKAVAAPDQEKNLSANKVQVEAALESVKAYIEPINTALQFSLNEDTDQIVVKIVDRETMEVIRQMPSEEMIAIAKALDSIKGLFVKQSA